MNRTAIVVSLCLLVQSTPVCANPTRTGIVLSDAEDSHEDCVSMMELVQSIAEDPQEPDCQEFLWRMSGNRFARVPAAARAVIGSHLDVFLPLLLEYQHPGCSRRVDVVLSDWLRERLTDSQRDEFHAVVRLWLTAPKDAPCHFDSLGLPIRLWERVVAAEVLVDAGDSEAVPLIATLIDSLASADTVGTGLSDLDRRALRQLELTADRARDPASAVVFLASSDGTVRMTRDASDSRQLLVEAQGRVWPIDSSELVDAASLAAELVTTTREVPEEDYITFVFAGDVEAMVAPYGEAHVALWDNMRVRPVVFIGKHDRLRAAAQAMINARARERLKATRRTPN